MRIRLPLDPLFIIIPVFAFVVVVGVALFIVVVATLCHKYKKKDKQSDRLILELERLESSVAHECKQGGLDCMLCIIVYSELLKVFKTNCWYSGKCNLPVI